MRTLRKTRRPSTLGRLPRHVDLGGPYLIPIILVAPSVIREKLDEDDDVERVGFWDDEDHVIYIDSTVARRRKWEAYCHELVHAAHDVAVFHKGGI